MKKRTLLSTTLIKMALLLLCSAPFYVKAQEGNPYLQCEFNDTMVADDQTMFLRNNLTITNIYQNSIEFKVHMQLPGGFNLISQNDVLIQLGAGEKYVLPLTISKAKTAPAMKQMAAIIIALKNPAVTLSYNFSLQCKETKTLRITPIKNTFQVSKDNRSVRLALKIKNIGNSSDNFYVHFTNKNFQIDKKIKAELAAFTDTLIYYNYTIPAGLLNEMDVERIVANVGNDTNFLSFTFMISKIRNNNAGHKSAYLTMPLTVETGIFKSKTEQSYFWGVSGAIFINDNNSISYNYRSRQYGVHSLQNDVFSVFYRHKNWDFNVGQMTESRYFIVTGLGAMASFHKNETEGFSISAISNLTSMGSFNKNEAITANTNFKIGKFFWNSTFVVNRDPLFKTVGYVFNNKVTVFKNDYTDLSLCVGGGLEQYSEREKTLKGLSYGYNFTYYKNRWELASSLLFNDNSFPGIYKGWRSSSHGLNYHISRSLFAGLFYNSNYTKQNYFLDSNYYQNQFLYNLTTYGFKTGLTLRPFSISASFGNAMSTGPLLLNNVPKTHFITSALLIPLGRYSRISFNTTMNIDMRSGTEQKPVVYYNQNGSFISKYGGVNFHMTQMPSFSADNEHTFTGNKIRSTSISPYINVRLLRNRVTGRLQYSYYRISDADRLNITQSVLGNISYANPKKGIELQCYGNYALKSTQNMGSFVSISLRKTFNIPILTSRKYFDLTLVLFEDKNGNGKKDESEAPVEDILTQVNTNSFISDLRGEIYYRNIERGNYTLDFHDMKNSKGLIPSQGFSQIASVNGQTKVEIPFTKGRILKGKIDITLDTLSRNTFSVGQLKVTALDSMGNKFTTFSDDNGGFRLNLPAGHYIVSLNPDAYDEVFKPLQMSYQANLLQNEEYSVFFHIKQKSRKINRIKANVN